MDRSRRLVLALIPFPCLHCAFPFVSFYKSPLRHANSPNEVLAMTECNHLSTLKAKRSHYLWHPTALSSIQERCVGLLGGIPP